MANESFRGQTNEALRQGLAVARESLRVRCIQAIHAVVPMSGALLVVGALLWSDVPHGRLFAWLSFCFLTTAVAALDCRLTLGKIATASPEELDRFDLRELFTTLLNTAAMGAGVWWIAAVSSPEIGFFVTLCVCFYAIGHVINGSSHRRNFLAGLFANLGQALIFWLLQGGIGSGIAIMLAGISYLLCTFTQQNYKTFSENVRMRFENLDLVEAVSEEKKAVERALAEAREASLAKSRFLAAASHDMRQPLHALSLWTGLLRESLRDPVALQRVDKVSLSVDSLNKLFSALLDLSRLDGGSVVPEYRNVELREMFAILGDDSRAKAEAQHIELRISETHARVWTDPVWLERVLRNLMDNAIKYTLQGSVSLHCEDDGDEVRIAIRDTGLGIAPDDQQRVFQEYFQVHNAGRDRAHGVGLGLAIVKRACDLLGHPITLRSELGVGSEFVITLPRSRAAVMASPDRTPDIANASGEFDGLVVVVVEDDREVAQATHAVLEEWRCIPVSCTGAEDAISQLEAQRLTPHGVIADYRLAGVATGCDAIALLRRRFGSLPAALLTGEVNAAELQDPNTAYCAVLQKPLTAGKLRDLLRGFRSASVAGASASVG